MLSHRTVCDDGYALYLPWPVWQSLGMRADGALERRFVGRRCLSVSNFTMFKLNEPHVAMSTLLESASKAFHTRS